jgi:hypothetical protein
MEPEVSLPRSQQPATCPYPQPDQPNHVLPSYFFQIHFNIILPLMPRSSKWSLSFRFLLRHSVRIYIIPHACHIPYSSHPPLYDYQLRLGEQHKSQSCPLYSFLQSAVISSVLDSNIFLGPKLKNTLCLRSSLNVRDQVSHQHKTEGKTTFCIYFVSEKLA